MPSQPSQLAGAPIVAATGGASGPAAGWPSPRRTPGRRPDFRGQRGSRRLPLVSVSLPRITRPFPPSLLVVPSKSALLPLLALLALLPLLPLNTACSHGPQPVTGRGAEAAPVPAAAPPASVAGTAPTATATAPGAAPATPLVTPRVPLPEASPTAEPSGPLPATPATARPQGPAAPHAGDSPQVAREAATAAHHLAGTPGSEKEAIPPSSPTSNTAPAAGSRTSAPAPRANTGSLVESGQAGSGPAPVAVISGTGRSVTISPVSVGTAGAAAPALVAPPAQPPLVKEGWTVVEAPRSRPAATSPTDPQVGNFVVLDPGAPDDNAPKTLVEAAQAEKERRAQSGRPAIVITDKNLHQYAKKGQITVAAPHQAVTKQAQPGVAPAAGPPPQDEQYWRNRGLEIRQRWHKAAEQVKDLEQKAADLRRRFYGQDDPYIRDGQIKPLWDRALDQLREAQNETDLAKKELAEFLEDGRVKGALPGWLREGIDREPPPEPKPVKPGEGIETPIIKDSGT